MDTPKSIEKNHSSNLNWEADEFFYHPKGIGWYLISLISSLCIATLPWLMSGKKDYLASIVILLSLAALIIYAGRKPQKKAFSLSESTLKINSQSFDLLNFSRFWVEESGTHKQITLVGIKRTAMPISLYLQDKALADKVLRTLHNILPETEPSMNPVDWLMRKIKF